jgi:hypothetical protein
MSKYIKNIEANGQKYIVRGFYKKGELEKHYNDFVVKYNSTITFQNWLIIRGKIVKKK